MIPIEEENIQECLESLRWLDDIVVVVDASSTDATYAKAKEYTSSVCRNHFKDFSTQRNFLLMRISESSCAIA